MKKCLLCLFVVGSFLSISGCEASQDDSDKSTKSLTQSQEVQQNEEQQDIIISEADSTSRTEVGSESCIFDKSKISDDLNKYIDFSCEIENIDIALAFDNTVDVSLDEYEMEEINGKYYLNGKEMSKEMWDAWSKARDDEQTRIAQAIYLKRLSIIDEIRNSGLVDEEDAFNTFIISLDALVLHQVDVCLLKKLTCFKYLINIDVYRPMVPAD